jgi:hypothetical protein
MNVNDKVICSPIPVDSMSQQQVFGSNYSNAHLIVRSSVNEELLYLDGACGPEPIFMGITKSRGTQDNKLPVEAGDFLGGIQLYARKIPGASLGYRHEQTPLVGAIQFKVNDDYCLGEEVLTDLLIGLTAADGMSIKLKVDYRGNLIVASNITLGDLTLTDKTLSADVVDQNSRVYIKVTHNGIDYAMPMFKLLV